jgi:hypothetical protein
LNRRLDDCALNWKNELILVLITMITIRVLTVCNSTRQDKVTDLALKCRHIGEKWIDLICESIQTVSLSEFDQVENLRLNIVTIGVACILTFSIHMDRIHCVLSSN